MSRLFPAPYRLLAWGAALAKAMLWLVAAGWLLAGLTLGAIHGIIVPRIAQWLPDLEVLATRATGIPVRIGHIQAHSRGWIPSFELSDVRLVDPQGRDALVLKRVLTAVSVPSLWRMGFEQIYIDQPELDVRRRADGHIEVAGLDLMATTDDQDTPNAAADWFFAQTEFALRGGTVRWTDELHHQPPVTLSQVDLVVRNPGRRHLLRLDATPAEGLSGRFTLMGAFRSPLFSLHPGRVGEWRGTAYTHMPSVDLARLAAPVHLTSALGLSVQEGHGALRWWVDVDGGQLVSTTLDLALTGVQAHFAQTQQPLSLKTFEGRVELTHQRGGWELSAPQMTFETASGTRWQPDRLRASWHPDDDRQADPSGIGRGELSAGRLDLRALSELATALPLPPEVLSQLASLQPAGQLDNLTLNWHGNQQAWDRYSAKGKGSGLSLTAALTPPPGHALSPKPRRPGFSGAAVDFQFDQQGGQAKLDVEHGELVFPGVFEDPTVPMDRLTADLRWTLQGGDIQAQFQNVRFSNADVQGQASGQWRTSHPDTSPARDRFPGVLQLDGSLSRARGDRVHRYLPLVVAQDARRYVRDAIVGGESHDVRFHVHGDLWDMPFDNPATGDFRITAKVNRVDYAFVPPGWQPETSPKWPALRQLDGELVFSRSSMSLQVARGSVADAPGLKVTQASARIAELSEKAVVEVNAQIEGPLSDALTVVRRSPLADMTRKALNDAKGSGPAVVQFGLKLPVAHLAQTTVKGSVTLPGNDLLVTRNAPLLARTRGVVEFSDKGFQVPQATARVAGGELQFSGGMRDGDPEGLLKFQGQGTATAEGLRQMPQLGPVAQLARHAQGGAPYQIQLQWGPLGPEWAVQTALQGVQVNLPAPLSKPTGQAWPLSYRNTLQTAAANTAAQELLQVDLANPDGALLALRLQRPVTATAPPPWRGVVAVGASEVSAPLALPATGVTARLNLPDLDADAWDAAWSTAPASPSAGNRGEGDGGLAVDQVQLQTPRLTSGGKTLTQFKASARRQNDQWSGQVHARELEGQFDYLPPGRDAPARSSGQLRARLKRLQLQNQPGTESAAAPAFPPPASSHGLPALDVEVAALEVDGRALGTLSLQAINRTTERNTNEWRLHHFSLKLPEAELSGSGNWVTVGASSPDSTAQAPRRTALNLVLDIHDSGALLNRFGMTNVVRGGKGQLTGQLAWLGLPYALHTPSLTGQLHIDLNSGQFLKADPGIAKLLGVLSLQSLPRRLALDFRDVFSQGFAFDFVRGDAQVERGVARTNNLQMKGPSAAVLLEGSADIGSETQDIRAVVVPELNAGTASLIATVINPAIGLGTFLAQAIIRQPLIQASTQTFRIHGPWADPVVDRVLDRAKDVPDAAPATP
jgi:uncharacterized protein (TIGR02099 family)